MYKLTLLLKEKRERLGLTQKALAEKLEIMYAFYGMIEHGRRKIPIKKLESVADFLEIGVEEAREFRDTPIMFTVKAGKKLDNLTLLIKTITLLYDEKEIDALMLLIKTMATLDDKEELKDLMPLIKVVAKIDNKEEFNSLMLLIKTIATMNCALKPDEPLFLIDSAKHLDFISDATVRSLLSIKRKKPPA